MQILPCQQIYMQPSSTQRHSKSNSYLCNFALLNWKTSPPVRLYPNPDNKQLNPDNKQPNKHQHQKPSKLQQSPANSIRESNNGQAKLQPKTKQTLANTRSAKPFPLPQLYSAHIYQDIKQVILYRNSMQTVDPILSVLYLSTNLPQLAV
ncbi:hypothetical protein U1Q18_028317 [Sarracenia purpurea var. burkii]